jgi:hypothetical protein
MDDVRDSGSWRSAAAEMQEETPFRSGQVILPSLGRRRALGFGLGHGDLNTAGRVEPSNVFVDEIDLEEENALDGGQGEAAAAM